MQSFESSIKVLLGMETKRFFVLFFWLIAFGMNAQLSVRNLGTSGNAFSNSLGVRNSIASYPAGNMLMWVYRSSSPNNSGTIKLDLSIDGGNTWQVGKFTPWTTTGSLNRGRYPRAFFFNPPGNSNLGLVWSNTLLPITSNSNYATFGSWVLNSTAANGGFTRTDSISSRRDTTRQIISGFSVLPDRVVVLDKNGNLGIGNRDFKDTFAITTLKYTAAGFVSSTKLQPLVMYANASLNKSGCPDATLAFNETGSIGYLVAIGHIDYTAPDNNQTMLPIVMTTVDSGQTWSSPVQLSIASQVRTQTGMTGDFSLGYEIAASVDQNGKLHLLCYVGKSLNSFDTLAAGRSSSAMMHFVTNGTTLLSAKALYNPYSMQGFVGNGINGLLLNQLRPCISKSVSGDKLFFSWFATDSLLSTSNTKPDLWVAGYDVTSNSYLQARNVTANTAFAGKIVFGSAAPLVFSSASSGGTTDYEIPVTYTQFGSANSVNDSVFHKYLKGVVINSAQFGSAVTISSTGSIICGANGVTLTSSSSSNNQWLLNGAPINGATNQTYQATSAGNYVVVVTSSGKSDTSNTIQITAGTVPAAPVISSGNGLVICPGTSISLTANISTGTINWTRNAFTFGTGSTITTDSTGTYQATVSLNGCTSVVSNSIVLTQGQKAIAIFSVNDSDQCIKGNSFIFNNQTANTNLQSSNWSFGNGITSSTISPTYSYSSAGTYSVKLKTTSTTGCVDSITKQVIVVAQDTARITANGPTTFCQGDSINLSSNSTQGNQWLLNGIAILSANQVVYAAKSTGSYRLVVSRNGCTDTSAISNITVNPLPTTPTINRAGAVLTSSASSGNQWLLNGNPINGATSNTYMVTSSGTYSVRVTNGNGCSSTSTTLLVQLSNAPVISASSATTFCSGGSVILSSTSAANYQWLKNNAVIPGANAQTYSATTTGTYAVVVTVSGNSDTSNRINVTVNTSPTTPVLTPSSTVNICPNGTTNFSVTIPTGSTVTWYLNGNAIGTPTTNPTLAAVDSGRYTAIVQSNGCSSSPSLAVQMNIQPSPIALFYIADSIQCLNGNQFNITNRSSITSGSVTYMWNLGNSTTSTVTSPTVTYTSAGTYSVKVVVSSGFGCKDSISKTVVVNPSPRAKFGVNTTSQCLRGNLFNVTDSSTISTGTLSQSWNFGNGRTASGVSASNSYQSAGNFDIKLVVISQNGCADSTVKPVIVKPQTNLLLQANGTTTFCFGDSVELSANPFPAGANWLKNDTVFNQTAANYFAKTSGAYKIVYTFNGCSDTSQSVQVTANPVPAKPNITVTGSQLSTNATGTIQWYFNGNLVQGATSSTYNGSVAGFYSVSATNGFGCSTMSDPLRITGTKELAGIGVQVYPNPASGSVTLSLDKVISNGMITILDITGKVQSKLEIYNTEKQIIDISKLPAGIYLIELEINGQRLAQKLSVF